LRVPFAFNRLRTVIMTSLAFLILSAMLLIHVVTAKLTERDLINARIQSGRVLLQAVNIISIDNQSNRRRAGKTNAGEPILAGMWCPCFIWGNFPGL